MATFYFFSLLLLIGWTNGETIESTPVTNYGTWGNMEQCPPEGVAQGFQLKSEGHKGTGDDTALNAIRLFCGDPAKPDIPTVTSSQGEWGNWGKVFTCFPGVLTGFQLRVEPPQGKGVQGADDTATNNIKLWCTKSVEEPGVPIEGDGAEWGVWGDTKQCTTSGTAICGIQTQVEPWQGKDERDDTALNNVKFECCPHSLTIS